MATYTSDPTNTDDLIATDLARANLCRLRGDYEQAEAQCTDLLKRAPSNPTVATLLGDISAEQNKLEAARNWYEMAVDAGAPVGIEEKLTTIKQRLKERDDRRTEDGIGLPSRSTPSPALVLGAVLIVLFLLSAAYLAGTRTPPSTSKAPQVDKSPIVLPKQENPALASEQKNTEQGAPQANESQPVQTPSKPSSDPMVADLVGEGSRITGAWGDPRTGAITVEANLQQGEDPRQLAAALAEQVYGKNKEVASITLRLLDGGRPAYMADVSKAKLDAAATANSSDASALPDQLLENEWRAPAK